MHAPSILRILDIYRGLISEVLFTRHKTVSFITFLCPLGENICIYASPLQTGVDATNIYILVITSTDFIPLIAVSHFLSDYLAFFISFFFHAVSIIFSTTKCSSESCHEYVFVIIKALKMGFKSSVGWV